VNAKSKHLQFLSMRRQNWIPEGRDMPF